MAVETTRSVSAIYRKRVPSSLGAVRTGGVVRNCFNYVKAVSAFSDHTNFSEALSSLKNGKPFSPSRDMKWLRVAIQPVSF